MKMKLKKIVSVVLVVLVSIVSIIFTYADPTGPSIDIGTPETRTLSGSGTLVQADAGNMTALNMNGTKITQRWQGYFGNISGTITLDDAAANTMYSWSLTSPQGEIYAVNDSTTPTWSGVKCFNFSKTSTEQNVTLSNLEATLGMSPTDDDTVNKTFNMSLAGSFTIGSSNTINPADGCQVASLYVNDVWEGLTFNETILTDNSSRHAIIYTTFIENGDNGFSNAPLDFQLIVGDDGDTEAATDYYFYIELT